MTARDLFELRTPCFILNEDTFIKSLTDFKAALDRHFKRNIVGVSVKTNSMPYLLRLAKDQGCFAEVVSYDEYNLAMLCGYDKNKIIYNGPLKSEETFKEALINGAIVNIETKRELDWLEMLPENREYKVGIRINVNVSQVSREDTDKENDNSRFGFSEADGELAAAVNRIKSMNNVRLTGVHLHRTTKTRSVSFYRNLVSYAAGLIRKHEMELDYIDVGGGYYGTLPGKPSYADYADTIAEVLNANGLGQLCVIVEPGSSIMASAFDYMMEVIDHKTVGGDYIVTTNGSCNDVDPFFNQRKFVKTEVLYRSGQRKNMVKQIVGGCTCLEFDRMMEIEHSPQIQPSDRIHLKNTGAYTMCLSPLFIRFYPYIYVYRETGGGPYRLIRDKWDASALMHYIKI